MSQILKAYKYRIYPNKEQEIQITKTFGCCRFVYNQTLAYKKDTYDKEKKSEQKQIKMNQEINYFYSNCLLEALKAKIRDPKNIKIRYLPAKLNEIFTPHFMWQDQNYTYDFYTKGKLSFVQQFFHKGVIRKNELDYYDRALETMKKRIRRNKNG